MREIISTDQEQTFKEQTLLFALNDNARKPEKNDEKKYDSPEN